MKDLFESLKDLKFDKRMIRWNINRKALTPEEHKNHLKSLEDITHLQNTEEIKDQTKDDNSEKKEE